MGNDPTNAFRFLRLGPGEDRLVRENLAEAKPGRRDRRRSLAYLGQIMGAIRRRGRTGEG